MYKPYNENSCGLRVGDCVIRAISLLTNKSWDETYVNLAFQGFKMCDMPSSNSVWGQYLIDNGYSLIPIQPITVKDFCIQFPQGVYLLATGSHVVTIKDGDYFDSWDSGNELIIYYFTKEE